MTELGLPTSMVMGMYMCIENASTQMYPRSEREAIHNTKMTVMMPSKSSQFWHTSQLHTTILETLYKRNLHNTVKHPKCRLSPQLKSGIAETETDTDIQEQFRNLRLNTSTKHQHHPAHIQVHHNPWAGERSQFGVPHAIWKCFYSSFGLHFHDHNLTSKNSIGCQILERRIFSASSSVALLKLKSKLRI